MMEEWAECYRPFRFCICIRIRIHIRMDYGFAADFPHRTQMPFVQMAIYPGPLDQTIRCS